MTNLSRKIQLARELFGGSAPATSDGAARRTTGTAKTASDGGRATVEFADGGEMECECLCAVGIGDIVTVLVQDGKAVVIGVTGWGDIVQEKATTAQGTADAATETATAASKAATTAQTTAAAAKQTAASASSTASSALAKATDTQNYFFHDADGAHVSDTAGALTGQHVDVTDDGLFVRRGSTTLSRFTDNAITLNEGADGSTNAYVSLFANHLQMACGSLDGSGIAWWSRIASDRMLEITSKMGIQLGSGDAEAIVDPVTGQSYTVDDGTVGVSLYGGLYIYGQAGGEGAVLSVKGDITENGSKLSKKYAPLASPAFTGVPTAPTADSSTDSTQIATTAYVRNAIRSSYIEPVAAGPWQFGEKARSATDTYDYTGDSWTTWNGALRVLLCGVEHSEHTWSDHFSKVKDSYSNAYGFKVIKAGIYRIELRMTGAATTRYGLQIYHATDSAVLAESSAYSNGAVTGGYCSVVADLDAGDEVDFRLQPFGSFTHRLSGAMSNVTIEYLDY